MESKNLNFLKVSSSRAVKYDYAIIFKNEKKIKEILGLEALDNKKLVRKQFRNMCERINEQYASIEISKADAKQLNDLFALFGFNASNVKDKLSKKVLDAIFV